MGAIHSRIQEFTVAAGAERTITLDSPMRGVIKTVLVRNVGDAGAFTFDLYTHEDAIADTATFDREMYAIMNVQSSSAEGSDSVLELREKDFAYSNQDADGKTANMKPKLYGAINITGAGNKTVQVRLDVQVDI